MNDRKYVIAWNRGVNANLSGADIGSRNPYHPGEIYWMVWRKGFQAGFSI